MKRGRALNESVLPARAPDQVLTLPLFAAMPKDALVDLVNASQIQDYAQGHRLLERGEAAQALHVLIAGKVGLFGADRGGQDAAIEIVEPGGLFIAAAVLTGKPYLMSAVAMTPAKVLEIPVHVLRAHLSRDTNLATAMLTSLSERYRIHVEEIKALSDALESRLFLAEPGEGSEAHDEDSPG